MSAEDRSNGSRPFESHDQCRVVLKYDGKKTNNDVAIEN